MFIVKITCLFFKFVLEAVEVFYHTYHYLLRSNVEHGKSDKESNNNIQYIYVNISRYNLVIDLLLPSFTT